MLGKCGGSGFDESVPVAASVGAQAFHAAWKLALLRPGRQLRDQYSLQYDWDLNYQQQGPKSKTEAPPINSGVASDCYLTRNRDVMLF